MNRIEKKEMYNRIMEATSQMVVKMLNEDAFDNENSENEITEVPFAIFRTEHDRKNNVATDLKEVEFTLTGENYDELMKNALRLSIIDNSTFNFKMKRGATAEKVRQYGFQMRKDNTQYSKEIWRVSFDKISKPIVDKICDGAKISYKELM